MSSDTRSLLSKLKSQSLPASKLLILLLLTSACIFAYSQDAFENLENLTLDARFKFRQGRTAHPKIVLVEIAEDSLDHVGRWPWDRDWHAAMVRALKAFGARSVAFDVIFSEPGDAGPDNAFAQEIQNAGNVFLPVAFDERRGKDGQGIIRPIPSLRSGLKGEGHITIIPDRDGILRRIKLKLTQGDSEFLQLGFAMALDYLGVDPADVQYYPKRILFNTPDNLIHEIPLTKDGDFLINWPGTWEESFYHTSFIDVIVSYTQKLKGEKTRIPTDIFKDALCIIGVSATGLFDIRATPLDAAYPAMSVNASVLDSVIQDTFLYSNDDMMNIGMLWLWSALIFCATLRANHLLGMGLVIVMAIAYVTLAFSIFASKGIVLLVTYPVFLMLISYIVLTIHHQLVVYFEKKQLLTMATTDSLTGLVNIGHFKRLLQVELIRARCRRFSV